MIHPFLAAALLVAQAAPAASDCITREEAGDMAVSLLPYVIDGAAQRCREHLAPTAFLLNGAHDWSARLRRDSLPRRASALRGLGKFGDATPPEGAGGDAAFDFFAQMMTGTLLAGIRPENCTQIDVIAQSIEPLPTDNIARLVAAGISLGMSTSRHEDEAEASEHRSAEGPAGAETHEDRTPSPPICPA